VSDGTAVTPTGPLGVAPAVAVNARSPPLIVADVIVKEAFAVAVNVRRLVLNVVSSALSVIEPSAPLAPVCRVSVETPEQTATDSA